MEGVETSSGIGLTVRALGGFFDFFFKGGGGGRWLFRWAEHHESRLMEDRANLRTRQGRGELLHHGDGFRGQVTTALKDGRFVAGRTRESALPPDGPRLLRDCLQALRIWC